MEAGSRLHLSDTKAKIVYNIFMKAKRIPTFFKPIMWSYKVLKLDPERDMRTLTIQTINYGQWKHWQWLSRFYGRNRIKRLVEQIPRTEFRPSALKLAAVLFGIKKMKYASRSSYVRSQKNLARA